MEEHRRHCTFCLTLYFMPWFHRIGRLIPYWLTLCIFFVYFKLSGSGFPRILVSQERIVQRRIISRNLFAFFLFSCFHIFGCCLLYLDTNVRFVPVLFFPACFWSSYISLSTRFVIVEYFGHLISLSNLDTFPFHFRVLSLSDVTSNFLRNSFRLFLCSLTSENHISARCSLEVIFFFFCDSRLRP